MSDVPFGKVPAWVGDENCPLSGAVEFGLIAILAARRAVRRRRFFYKGVEVWLEPGHVCVSQRDLAQKLKVDRKRIRTALNNLEKLQILGPPKGPAEGPPKGPVPKIFFFNVDMQLDVFGELHSPTKRPTSRPNNRPKRGPTEAQQGPTSIDVKMDRRLEGRVARETEPHGQDPPSTPPDPKKFEMSENWAMGPATQTRLHARFIGELGIDGFWRQVDRFIEHHRSAGTSDSQAGFERSLEGWLARADANRDGEQQLAANGHANGTAGGGNGHDPPKDQRGKGDFDQLFARGILVFEDEHRLVLSTLQKSIMRNQFWKAFNGEEVEIGPDKGPTWSADQMFGLLPKFDRLAEP